ncbi:twin-arginine translocase TatA/TatE family subunit, partial [Peribacillus sp. NPDC060186]
MSRLGSGSAFFIGFMTSILFGPIKIPELGRA